MSFTAFLILSFLFFSVDGGYSDWSAWSACTVTCGGGSRMRNRKCNNPAPANDGKTCFDQQLGSEMESEACNIEQCEGERDESGFRSELIVVPVYFSSLSLI